MPSFRNPTSRPLEKHADIVCGNIKPIKSKRKCGAEFVVAPLYYLGFVLKSRIFVILWADAPKKGVELH